MYQMHSAHVQVILFDFQILLVKKIQQWFQEKFGFPKVLGCIDGSDIPIIAPSTYEPLYVNRKGYHSINVQAINSNCKCSSDKCSGDEIQTVE